MNYQTYDAVVIGTGAAGYNAACRLKEGGKMESQTAARRYGH